MTRAEARDALWCAVQVLYKMDLFHTAGDFRRVMRILELFPTEPTAQRIDNVRMTARLHVRLARQELRLGRVAHLEIARACAFLATVLEAVAAGEGR